MIFPLGSETPRIHPSAFIHPTAEISGKVKIGPNVSVWGGCILRGDIEWIDIGEDTNIQDGSIFHTSHHVPVVIGNRVTIGHKALIHGATVQDECLIGMGAILMDRSLVEENCIVGAGALVIEKGLVPKGHLAVGSPAQVKRPLKPEEIKLIVERSEDYVRYAQKYLQALKVSSLL